MASCGISLRNRPPIRLQSAWPAWGAGSGDQNKTVATGGSGAAYPAACTHRPVRATREERRHDLGGADAARPVRNPRATGRRRDGRGVPRPRHAPGPGRRRQGPARTSRPGQAGAVPLQPRGQGHRGPVAPAHRDHLRRRRRPRPGVRGHGTARGQALARPAAAGDFRLARGGGSRDGRRRRPGRGARQGRHPPRRQAAKRLPDERRRRQSPRLRPGPRRAAGRGGAVGRAVAGDPAGRRARDRGVHVAGAGAGPHGRRPQRRVRRGLRALRDGHWPAPVLRPDAGRHHGRDPARLTAGSEPVRPTPPRRSGPGHPPVPGEGGGPAVPVRPRAGPGPARPGRRRAERLGLRPAAARDQRLFGHAAAGGARGPHAVGRRPAIPEHEFRCGERVLQRRPGRGTHQRPGQGRRPARHLPHVGLRLQGQERGRPPHRRAAQRADGPGGERPQSRQPAADQCPARQGLGRLPALGGDL